MKTSVIVAVLVLINSYISAQTIETIQIHIDELEGTKANLEKQIEEIEDSLSRLYKTKHELRLSLADHGFRGYTREEVEMIDKPFRMGEYEVLAKIPKNTLLLVEQYESGSYKTAYNGMSGYIPAYKFSLNDSENKYLLEAKGDVAEAQRKQQREEELKKEAELRRQKALEAQKKREAEIKRKYSPADAYKIINHQIWIGMTERMLIDSWGRPGYDNINRSVGSWGTHEQWVYDDTYVYLENGIVTSWQD